MREPIDLNWRLGEHAFLLTAGEVLALEESLDAPVSTILGRLRGVGGLGGWSSRDAPEIVRLGLIGAGMARQDARKLAERARDEIGLIDLAPIAEVILFHSIRGNGPVEDDAGKKKDQSASTGEG